MHSQKFPNSFFAALPAVLQRKIVRDEDRLESSFAPAYQTHERLLRALQYLNKILHPLENEEASDAAAIEAARFRLERLKKQLATEQQLPGAWRFLDEPVLLAKDIFRRNSGISLTLSHTPYLGKVPDPEETVFGECRLQLEKLDQQWTATEEAPRTVAEMKAALTGAEIGSNRPVAAAYETVMASWGKALADVNTSFANDPSTVSGSTPQR